MSGLLLHSPADIVRALLVIKGVGDTPPSLNWPVYSDAEVQTPDNVVIVTNSGGKDSGREHILGEMLEHHGITLQIRCTTPPIGYVKARQIAVACDKSVYMDDLVLDTSTYRVHAITRTGDVQSMGKESPTSKRTLYSFDALVSVRLLS